LKTKRIIFGKAELRIAQDKDGFVGIVAGRSAERFRGVDEATVIRALEGAVLSQSKEFVGLDGARQRFLALFPGGFTDPGYIGDQKYGERAYKVAASNLLRDTLPLGSASRCEDAGRRALRVVQKTNVIDPYTKAKLADVLRGPRASEFLSICEEFTTGDVAAACERLSRGGFASEGVNKWVCLTYLPFLWRPDLHMFLKPEFTRGYAERIGHRFQHDYETAPNPETYASLLDMTEQTRRHLADLGPDDNIDIHSFMWVVMDYPSADEAVGQAPL
jgi:hypothetical protein